MRKLLAALALLASLAAAQAQDIGFSPPLTVINYTAGQQATINAVKLQFASAAFPSVMTSPPSVTPLTSGTNSPISGHVFVPITSASVYVMNESYLAFQYAAGLNDGIQHNFYFYGTAPYGQRQEWMITNFSSNASEIDLLFSGNSVWQMLVNGQLVSNAYQTSPIAGASLFLTRVVFGNNTTRNIQLFTDPGAAYAGFYVGPADSVSPLSQISQPTAAWMADSYGPIAGTTLTNGISLETGKYLGFQNIVLDPVGGTGFTARNGVAGNGINNFLDRLSTTSLPAAMPGLSVHISNGGINDTTAASVAQSSTTYFQTLRTNFPNTIIVATGPWCPNGSSATNTGTKYPGIRDQIKASLKTISGPWVFVDNLTGAWVNSSGASGAYVIPALQGPPGWTGGVWQTGNGFVGNTTGNGNGDTWVSSDGTHPTVAGVDGLSQLLAGAISAGISAL